tara:strand:- start:2353 stop:3450 length:1098 start_codon:yes stop_codon:yes gene_type:complete
MEQKRLHFIDAIRAWAILMMLQGHFIDGLLAPQFRDQDQDWFQIWTYFRGITAPVFFTASGLIFTYLLFKNTHTTYVNKRIKKGLKRGVQLIVLGYLLRLNLQGLLNGHIYPSFFYVDVLHCIGLAILILIFAYKLIGHWSIKGFSIVVFALATLIFSFEPWFKGLDWSNWPVALSHYFTRENGALFTFIPWVGYSFYGAFMAVILVKLSHKKMFYPIAILGLFILGTWLKYDSSRFFIFLGDQFGWKVFSAVAFNNYLFIRLGDVFWVLGVFMLGRQFLQYKTLLAIGQNTLSIYVIHAVILYGSFHGFGLYKFFKKSLNVPEAFAGGLLFVLCCVSLSFLYEYKKGFVKDYISRIFKKNKNYE